jgi:predicted transcriptional regulator
VGTLTVRLDDETERRLDELAARRGKSRSDIVREALRRQLAIDAFEQARREVLPFAEARGFLSDEDVFRDVS